MNILYSQAEEVTEELLTFHQAMNKMQEMEEVLVDEYKSYYDVRNRFRDTCIAE